MPAALIIALVLVGVALGLGGSPRSSLTALVVTWLLVPGGARLPGIVGGPLYIHRIILLSAFLGIVRLILIGRLDRRVFAPRGVHVALGAVLIVGFVNGVLLSEHRVPSSVDTNAYLNVVEQVVFFVVILALIRAVGARTSATIISAVAGVFAAIALCEHYFAWSYAQWFTRSLFDPEGLLSVPLRRRGPHLRVKSSATFALEFSWIAAMLLPVTAATALTLRRRTVMWLVPPALAMAMIWSWSRSAYAGAAIGLFVLFLGVVLDRPLRLTVLGIAGFALTALVVRAPLEETLNLGAHGADQDARFDRVPEILAAVSPRPFTGLGYSGLLSRRIRLVDVSWLITYATTGVLGLIALAALLLASIHAVTRFVRSGPSPTRLLAAGAAGAVVAAPLGLLSYDLATLRASTETLWGLAALALVANEELGVLARVPLRRPHVLPSLAIALGAVGLVAGVALAVIVPERSSVDATFTTVAPRAAAVSDHDQPYVNKALSRTACAIIDAAEVPATVHCQSVDLLEGGIGTVRVEAADPADVRDSFLVVSSQLHEGMRHSKIEIVRRGRGRPNWATTAPLWLAAIGIGLGSIATDKRRPSPGSAQGDEPEPTPSGAMLSAEPPGDPRGPGSARRAPLRAARPRTSSSG